MLITLSRGVLKILFLLKINEVKRNWKLKKALQNSVVEGGFLVAQNGLCAKCDL